MNLVAKAFEEGVKAAIQIFKKVVLSPTAVAGGMETVQTALEKAVTEAAKQAAKKASKR